jgi:hypothetical protein
MEPIQGVSPQVCPCHARPGPTARTASPTLSASVSAQPMRKLAWSRSVRPNRLGLAWAGAPARRCPPGSSHNRGETLLCVDRSCFRGAEPAACVAESLRSFDRSLPLLPVDVHATAIDQRGHGDAEKPRSGYSLEELAQDIEAFLDAGGISSAVLLASSSARYVADSGGRQPAPRGRPRPGRIPATLQARPSFFDQIEQLTDPSDAACLAVVDSAGD